MAKRQDKESSRWERMVRRVKGKFQYIEASADGYLIPDADVITLLRKEHRAVVRMIRSLQGESWSMKETDAYVNGYQRATYDILYKLKERAK